MFVGILFGLLGNQIGVSFGRPSDLSPFSSGMSASVSFSLMLFLCLFRARVGIVTMTGSDDST